MKDSLNNNSNSTSNNGSNNSSIDNNNEEQLSHLLTIQTSPLQSLSLDCYPYSFSPLLLFTSNGYFDRGYSNYNAVAGFFERVLRELVVTSVDEVGGEGAGGGGENGASDANINGGMEDGANNGWERRVNNGSPRRNGNNETDNGNNDEVEGGRGGIDMLQGVLYDRKNMT